MALRTSTPIRIDGILNEPIWQRPGVRDFIQREPQEGVQPSEETRLWVAYDDHALYIAVQMYDSAPDSIVGRLVRRDAISESDYVYVGIDSDFDRRTAYYFGTDPTGSLDDGTIYDDNKLDASWDGIWDVASHVHERGWSVEFRIPFSQLRFDSKTNGVWGIESNRRIHRKNEEVYLVLHPRNDEVRVSRWRELHGLEDIAPPSRIEIIPYLAGTAKYLKRPPVAPFNQGRKDPFILGRDYLGNVGLDFKVGLTGNITLDGSVNPDFAQVEVDPAVVNLSQYET
ncbi:MAG: DUF5916 domain-containing protein, partial [Bacteroidota bacterium]